MNLFKLIATSLVFASILSACAAGPGGERWYDNWKTCAIAGGVVGGAGAAVIGDDAAIGGVGGGAVIGGLICAMGDADGDGVKNHADKCPGTAPGGIVDERGCEIDSDSDGVVDRLDECPSTPQGASVDARGCEPDGDGDGVTDRLDRCPNTPAGAEVDKHGCELDGDGDGVVDRLDKCPGTAPGTPVDNSGCALALTVKLENVNFELDSAKLTADSTATLDDAVQILTRHADLKVEIAGHTDSQGAEDYNQGLSERRAQTVADYLVSNGANADNISVKGYGEAEPVADNNTEKGRADNRRVELRQQ